MKNRLSLLLISFFLLSSNLIAWDNNSSRAPERIISLGPSITESLFLLGAGDRIAGVTTYCIRPPEAQKKEKVGSVTDINIEKIYSLRPDLVIATSLTDRRSIEKLRRLGIRVEEFGLARNFKELCENFIRLGRLVGKEKEALKIVKRAEEELIRIRKSIKGLPEPRVFIQVGSKPLFTMTKDTFVNDLIELAGGINIAKDSPSGLWSREMVVEKDPDVIIITTMGVDARVETGEWLRFKSMRAVRNKRIYIIDSYRIGSPTPVTFIDTLKELVSILHEGHG